MQRDREKEEVYWALGVKDIRFARQDTVNSDVLWFKSTGKVYWTLFKPCRLLLQKEYVFNNDRFFHKISDYVVVS